MPRTIDEYVSSCVILICFFYLIDMAYFCWSHSAVSSFWVVFLCRCWNMFFFAHRQFIFCHIILVAHQNFLIHNALFILQKGPLYVLYTFHGCHGTSIFCFYHTFLLPFKLYIFSFLLLHYWLKEKINQ